uniref:Zn(2)-C6 fungal-type domain-containing protein n=2 Tax=Bionectria ochroleuca TaxID=29856 RepID=A0A8H7NQ61_BIOOC
MTEQIEAASPIRRTRITRIACKACHARRVKCDAADGLPCMHCRTRQDPCELIESRRGKYTRTPSKRQQRRTRGSLPDLASAEESRLGSNQPVNVTARHLVDSEIPEAEKPPERETQDAQVVGRGEGSAHLLNSLNLSSIIDMVRRAKDGDFENVRATTHELTRLVEKVNLQPSIHLHQQMSVEDALVLPDGPISDQMIQFFFEYFHPAYPVIDRSAFISMYRQGKASTLLLHSIFMAALTCGPESLVRLAGYTDRATAKKAHFQRAKRLYEVGHETDATSVAAALHLLSFWWSEPHEQESWIWAGCSVALAQSLGMHRALGRRRMSKRLVSIWKRIWWSIYIRDRHIAAALGRPCRIRDEDCDVEALTEDDFYVDLVADDELIAPQKAHHVSYFLDIAKLSAILGDILIGEFSPRPPALEKYEPTCSAQRLQAWRSEARCVTSDSLSTESSGLFFWASMLDVSYQNACILLFRPKPTRNQAMPESERAKRAQRAADAITRTAEDLLSVDLLQHTQLHLVPGLFSALSVYTLALDGRSNVHRKLVENKSRQCILALSELVKVWPVGMWLKMAFVNLLRRLVSQRSVDGTRGDEANENMAVLHGDQFHANSVVQPVQPQEVFLGSGLGTAIDFAYDASWFGSSECIFDAEIFQEELSSFVP